ncbi:MAG: NfeD family protein [Hyphomicrobium zavarzinii]|jgi:membrane protein implicated in regulation of membrane protease activity|uniref:NfeD family protein n=1 Tax=Hyphomicrobium TaxID=81 RepID=UPI000372761F|nr:MULTISPECIES: NfeD family protein [Hyphomicrobium]MBL8845121.1 NfeD family protein [Hyphomicrobium zavarzinii]WBT36354.1 NfeD family protein [Hyphomicrobium sp. DMF-1]
MIVDLVTGLGPWNWFIAGVLLMALETLVPGVHFLWFGLAAVVVGILVFALTASGLGEALSLPWQLVLFAVISVATVFWVRRFANAQNVESDEKDLNDRGAQYVGRIVVVEDAITSGRGRVRVGDTLWPASGADAEKGARVRITGSHGTVFIVEPA